MRAAAAGVVTFAGRVGSGRHVTLAHADGVRTTYSFLADVAVRARQEVEAGHVLGTSGTLFHFGARIGEAYVDPAVLLGVSGPVRLVPVRSRGLSQQPGQGAVPALRIAPAWRAGTRR